MEERYSRLYSLPENQYTVGAPILIAAGALLKDNQTGKALAQIKFRSISDKQIKAVKISVAAFDISGKEVEGVPEYQYLDLNVIRNTEFGQKQAVTLPDAVTRSFVVKCTDVFFADGTAWAAAPEAHWDVLPRLETITDKLGSLADQYQRDTSTRSRFAPVEYHDLWFCSCGALNHDGESECHACRQEKEKLFTAWNLEALDQRNEEYKAAEAEKAAKKAEADKIRRNKSKKIALIAAAIIAVIAAVPLLTTKVIIPNTKYNNAVALMEAGQYEEAIAAFEALNGYKNSETKIDECKIAILDDQYEAAFAMMEAEQYVEAITAFKALNGYKNSETKIDECKIAILDDQYEAAFAMMEAEQYVEAITAFKALNGYKDSANRIRECSTAISDGKYNDAIALMDAEKYIEAYEALLALNGYKDSADKASSIYDKYMVEKLKTAKVGDYVFFGAYEQDNNTWNGKENIEWLILEIKDGRALVISKYALDCKGYDTSRTDVTWETCTLRKWLNNDFINAAFSADEKTMIPTVTVSADKNPEYGTNPGKATRDQVFLLSITEANKYFVSDSARQCEPTDYVVANGAYVSSTNNCLWWLRSPGCSDSNTAAVSDDGDVFEYGYYASGNRHTPVRPALWIDLNA